jgi:hypothetical protein
MVRLSLAALLPGMKGALAHFERFSERPPAIVALILAGNTPLMSWSPLAACLLAGHDVRVKMSRHETLWPSLFRDAIAEFDPALAARITLDAWAGDDPRTTELITAADAVIAFGSDATLTAIRAQTPYGIPFFGFGHGISIGFVSGDAAADAGRFAQDILMYGQSGCLSPQIIFVVEDARGRASEVAATLAQSLAREVDAFGITTVIDPASARSVREARDMALFDGAGVTADAGLRWTIIVCAAGQNLPDSVGHGVITLLPVRDAASILAFLGASRAWISSVGIAGTLPEDVRSALAADGVSRFCPAGEMQTPPLDWPNGKIDLFAALREL